MITRSATIATLALLFVTVSAAMADDSCKARLSSDQEVVTPPAPPVVEDTTGKFEIQFNKNRTAGEYTLRVQRGERITQAHLHCGPIGVNGPVIVFLAGPHAPGWDVDGKWISNATVTDSNVVNTACGATLAAILEAAKAGMVYANVHSVEHGAGVVRGQLECNNND